MAKSFVASKPFTSTRGPRREQAPGARAARCSQLSLHVPDIQDVIDALLARRPAGFRNKDLADALGLSRSRVCRLLKPRLLSGELARSPRRSKYILGSDGGEPSRGVARGALAGDFWKRLVRDCPSVGYVSLASLGITGLRTRQQVQTAVRGIDWQRYLFVDFEGVSSISEVVVELPNDNGLAVQPINLHPAVARAIDRVLRLGHLISRC